jgi:hypothetical protein
LFTWTPITSPALPVEFEAILLRLQVEAGRAELSDDDANHRREVNEQHDDL